MEIEKPGEKVLLAARPFKCPCGSDVFQVSETPDYLLNTFTCCGCHTVYAHSGEPQA